MYIGNNKEYLDLNKVKKIKILYYLLKICTL